MGGTKIEAIAIGAGGVELARKRTPTPRSYQGSLEAVAALVTEVEQEAGGRGTVGVGIPGAISPLTGLVKNANSTWLIGKALDKDLEARLERPVRMSNDANCFALSEASDGAGAGTHTVFGVIVGTGVGGGIVIDGQVLEGVSRIAGEWGHNPLPSPTDGERPGPRCYCGRFGCVETFCSGPAMERDHREATGQFLRATEIAQHAHAGDVAARATLDRYVDRLARSLAVVVNILDPDVIVLGGGVSNVLGLGARVQDLLPPLVFSDDVATRVVQNVHGDSSGVRGAAWLWPETHRAAPAKG
jgi:fructokinase